MQRFRYMPARRCCHLRPPRGWWGLLRCLRCAVAPCDSARCGGEGAAACPAASLARLSQGLSSAYGRRCEAPAASSAELLVALPASRRVDEGRVLARRVLGSPLEARPCAALLALVQSCATPGALCLKEAHPEGRDESRGVCRDFPQGKITTLSHAVYSYQLDVLDDEAWSERHSPSAAAARTARGTPWY